MILKYLKAMLLFWVSVENGGPLHCSYSQIYFDSEWKELLASYLWVKETLVENVQY